MFGTHNLSNRYFAGWEICPPTGPLPRTSDSCMDWDKAARKAFLTALLLTGSMERAETAILEGARLLDPDEASGEALWREAVMASLEPPNETPGRLEDQEHLATILPWELRRVLRLSPDLRHCFVLRLLAGWPREVCARLLHLEIRQVDERTRTAVLNLAHAMNLSHSTICRAPAEGQEQPGQAMISATQFLGWSSNATYRPEALS